MAHPRLTLHPHLSPPALKHRYLHCRAPVERTRWHALWLLSQTDPVLSTLQVSRTVGRSVSWVKWIAGRYNEGGPDSLEDRRKHNGQQPILRPSRQRSLLRALKKSPPDGGLWSGPKVAQWMSNHLDRPVSCVTGWHYLRRLGFTLHAPRPRHMEAASLVEQRRFRKKMWTAGFPLAA